jgi:hypothetical protein
MSIHEKTEADTRTERLNPAKEAHSWSEGALSAFKDGIADGLHPDDVGGKFGQSFGEGLDGVILQLLPVSQVKRSEVFSLVNDASVNTATVCAAVMAWGGMNQRFSKKFFSMARDGWLDVADGIRIGQLDRQAAYNALSALRDDGKLYGVGPAYFTKIIYFLAPRSSATQNHTYIMDQWAGCSINLLVSRELVKMDVRRQWSKDAIEPDFTYRVSDANTGEEYEKFCVAADALRIHFNLTHDEVDRLMIANGGRIKSSWRNYVIKNRST